MERERDREEGIRKKRRRGGRKVEGCGKRDRQSRMVEKKQFGRRDGKSR